MTIPLQRVSSSGVRPGAVLIHGPPGDIDAAIDRLQPAGWRVTSVLRLADDVWHVQVRPRD